MRILFVLDRVENPASANAQLACRLAEQLLAQGHEIHLLELWDGENPPPAPPAGASQHTLAFADERLMNHALENGAKAGTREVLCTASTILPRPAAQCPCGCCGWRPTPRP